MKKSLSVLLLLLMSFTMFSQQGDKQLARVAKIQGVEAYFMCEPIRDYTVVFDEKTGLKASSIITGGLVNESIADKANQFVKKIIKEGEKEKIQFDAVIYTSGKSVVAVKFKEEGTMETKGIARVSKINGLLTFVLCEPLQSYKTVNEKGGGIKMKSALTGGIVNNSIEEDISKLVERIKKDSEDDKKEIDAVIYSAGKSAIGAKFD